MERLQLETETGITGKGVIDKLVELNELTDLLGYTDERSIESWCKKNKISLFHIGKKRYTIRSFLDLFLSQKMEEYAKATYKNADAILKAINEDNKTKLSKLVNAPLDKKVETKFKKRADCKEAADFMNKLKAA